MYIDRDKLENYLLKRIHEKNDDTNDEVARELKILYYSLNSFVDDEIISLPSSRVKRLTDSRYESKYFDTELIKRSIAREFGEKLLEEGVLQIQVQGIDDFHKEFYSQLIVVTPKEKVKQ